MNVDDLEWQRTHNGRVLTQLVDSLVEHGCLDLLVDTARERGDWACAQAAVRGLSALGEWERAWALIAPFAATGWRPAVRAGADVLLGLGRTSQALDLVRPHGRDEDGYDAWRDYAEVLVGAGRVDEAVDVLAARLWDMRMLWALVEVTEGRGYDERVLELLEPIAEEVRRDPEQPRARALWAAPSAQSRVLERSGRADEALRLRAEDVAADRGWPSDTVDDYAKLLARHGRLEELRELATGPARYNAVRPYVAALEAAGRFDEAEDYLRGLIADTPYPGNYESRLMELLMRQGRTEDALQVVEHTFDDLYDGNLLQAAMILLAEQGRHDRALEIAAQRSPEYLAENEKFWIRDNRWWLMGESGRCREAIAEVEALPEDEVDDRELTIAWLLAQDGRLDDAIARLRPLPGIRAATDLAGLLVRQGKYAEALSVIPDVAARREEERRFWTDRVQKTEPAGGL
ncbi:hypothetical protein ABTZ03_31070 [Kitasatospora sp. NPDC096077]|uniref:tetratricopeptide repeat protein n=1 Tax=Kitasatospora sp. NPDC096077 TaxID=3155544 RepID=UPI003323702F